MQLGYEDFNALAHVDPFSARSKRTFVVAPAQAAIFGLTRMYQIVRGETNIALFDTPEQALEWIQPKK